MRKLSVLFILFFLSACQTMPRLSKSHFQTVIEQELLPYLAQQVATNPVLKNHSLMIVKLTKGQISSDMDNLTEEVRRQMETLLLQNKRVHLYRSSQDLVTIQETRQQQLCLKRPQLFMGIEITQSAGQFQLSVRVLDKQNHQWLSGFSFNQTVLLDNLALKSLHQLSPDPWLQGFRESPYPLTKIDLASKDLGRQLRCQLMKQSGARSISLETQQLPQNLDFSPIISLLSTDLPMMIGLPLSTDSTNHLPLSLRWVNLNSQNGTGRLALTPVAGSAYTQVNATVYITGINAPQRNHVASVNSDSHSMILSATERNSAPLVMINNNPPIQQREEPALPLIEQISMDVPNDINLCHERDPWQAGFSQYAEGAFLAQEACLRLKIKLARPAHLILVSHASDQSWNRLYPVSCLKQTKQAVLWQQIPQLNDNIKALQMDGVAGTETVYLFAIENNQQATQFLAYLQRLPSACEENGSYYEADFRQKMLKAFQQIAPLGMVYPFQFQRF